MRYLLFWLMLPRFGVFSLACIIIALFLTPILGGLFAAGAIIVETYFQNVYKRKLLRHIRMDYRDF